METKKAETNTDKQRVEECFNDYEVVTSKFAKLYAEHGGLMVPALPKQDERHKMMQPVVEKILALPPSLRNELFKKIASIRTEEGEEEWGPDPDSKGDVISPQECARRDLLVMFSDMAVAKAETGKTSKDVGEVRTMVGKSILGVN